MATLLGKFDHTLDAKGRLIIPAKLRAGLGDTFVATFGLGRDCCVLLYPRSEFDRLASRINELPEFDDEACEARRVLGANAHDCTIDAQGRVMIPPSLREIAQLSREVVIIGALNKAEVWAKELYERALAQSLTKERLAEVRNKHVL